MEKSNLEQKETSGGISSPEKLQPRQLQAYADEATKLEELEESDWGHFLDLEEEDSNQCDANRTESKAVDLQRNTKPGALVTCGLFSANHIEEEQSGQTLTTSESFESSGSSDLMFVMEM